MSRKNGIEKAVKRCSRELKTSIGLSCGLPCDEDLPGSHLMRLGSEPGVVFGLPKRADPMDRRYLGKPMSRDGHILVVGEPGRGKTQGIVIPSMLSWTGTQIVMDLKGDLREYREGLEQGGEKKLKVFSPGDSEGGGCRFDPFAMVRRESCNDPERAEGPVRDLAMCLIPVGANVLDPVWAQAAQCFLTGAMLFLFEIGESFCEAVEIILDKPVQALIDDVKNDKAHHAVAWGYLSKLDEIQTKVLQNTGLEMCSLAPFACDPDIRKVLTPDPKYELLDWEELNTSTEPVDVILEIPEAKLERWEPMIRLMVEQLIRTLERRPLRTYDERELPPVLALLDEFPRLGKVPAIRNGLATLRCRGVTFVLLVQSLAQLREVYGADAAEVIIGNCAYKVVLGAADLYSQGYLSGIVGTALEARVSLSSQVDDCSENGSYGIQVAETREAIIQPHEFQTMKDVVVISPDGTYRAEKALFERKRSFFLPQPHILPAIRFPKSFYCLESIKEENENDKWFQRYC